MVNKTLNVEKFEDYNEEMHRITVESIQQATLKLLKEKSMEQITVKEIVAVAGVSRSAFYRNYQAKEDVLTDIIRTSFENIFRRINTVPSQDILTVWEEVMLSIVRDNLMIYELIAMGKWKSDHMLYVMNHFSGSLQNMMPDDTQKRRLCFISGGFYNVVIAWIQDGKKEPLEDVIHEVASFI